MGLNEFWNERTSIEARAKILGRNTLAGVRNRDIKESIIRRLYSNSTIRFIKSQFDNYHSFLSILECIAQNIHDYL